MGSRPERGGSYRIFFRFRGKLQTFTLGKVSKQEAEAKSAQVDYLLLWLIELPPGVVDIADFLQHDGKPPESVHAAPRGITPLVTLRDRFWSSIQALTRKPPSTPTASTSTT